MKLNKESVPYFVRYEGAIADNPTALWRSDDGINWTRDGDFQNLPGPGDETISGSKQSVYWAWGFTLQNYSGAANRYGIAGTSSNIVLTFPGDVSTNPDLQYFQAGDVVQSSGGTITYFRNESGDTAIANSKKGKQYRLSADSFPPGGSEQVTIGEFFGDPGFTTSNNTFLNGWVYSSIDSEDGAALGSISYTELQTRDDWLTYCGTTYFALSSHSGGGTPPGSDGDDLGNFGAAVAAATVISTGYPDNNTMVVDGGAWGPPVSEPGTNQATKWSTSLTSDDTWNYSGLEFGFDNNLATGANASLGTNATERTLSGFEEYFPNGSGPYTVEVWMTDPISAGVNGGAQVSPAGDDWVTLGSNLNEVRTIEFTAAQPVAFHAIRINSLVLKDGIETGKRVEYQTGGGEGSIIEVNTTDNTLLVTNSGDGDNRWIADNYGEGSGTSTDFYVAPAAAVPISQDYAWGKLQIVNNKAQVTGIQKDDPGFLPVPAKDYSIKFPAVFPTGNEPDDDLPRGTCVAAIVAAENSEGRSVKESNCFMPADVNPDGAAGPITNSTPTTLTVATNSNLGDFSSLAIIW